MRLKKTMPMNLNTKQYPKAVAYKKWMLVAGGALIVFVVILFMYNLSHQNTKKKGEKDSSAENQHQNITLASAQDTDWLNRVHKAPVSVAGNASTMIAPIDSTGAAPLSNGGGNAGPTTSPTEAPAKSEADIARDKALLETYQKQMEAREKAMMVPISANQLVGKDADSTGAGRLASAGNISNAALSGNAGLSSDPNGQASKEAFMDKAKNNEEDVYLDKSMIKPKSPYELQAGTLIPGILVTGINSDLPGQIVGQIRQNVYDSITGDNVLIPQGAKVVGLYDSKVTYGQERVLVVWKRIIYPNGDSLDLSGMPGIDLSGYAGFKDEVNSHFGKIFGSILLISTMSAGAQLSQPNNSNNDNNDYPTVGQTMAQSLGTNISDFGTKLADKNLGIQPTLVIRPGYLFNISVTKDIVFPGPYKEAY